MKVAFFAAEVFPYAKTGGLADVCGALPLVLEEVVDEIKVFMPHYGFIDLKDKPQRKIISDATEVSMGEKVSLVLVKNDALYRREGVYGDENGEFKDNFERFVYFCRRSFLILKQIGFQPNIIHCHDWHTALMPMYQKEIHKKDPFFKNTKCVYTIHNLAFQGVFDKDRIVELQCSPDQDINKLIFNDRLNFMKTAIVYSDRVTTVSPQYAKEIQTREFGFGLENVLSAHPEGIVGILNGIDDKVWNPKKDFLIESVFDQNSLEEKKNNKVKLQADCGFKQDSNCPLFGFVGRLTSQKGLDIIKQAFEELLQRDLQMVFLGKGEEVYERFLSKQAKEYPQKTAVFIEYNEKKSHRIYAGCDFFLMPSHFEPCGLGQMISMRYATVPIVTAVGGLVDTVKPLESAALDGHGFVLEASTPRAFMGAVDRALEIFKDSDVMQRIQRRLLKNDCSWRQSCRQYEKVYQECYL